MKDQITLASKEKTVDQTVEVKEKKCCSGHKHSHKDHHHSKPDMNSSLLDSTYLHQIGDFFSDIGLLIISVVLFFYPSWDIIDPIVSIIISLIGILIKHLSSQYKSVLIFEFITIFKI